MKTVNYKGFSIEIWNDEAPINPFADWDGLPPMITDIKDYGIDIRHYLSNKLTPGQIIRHQVKICEALDIDLSYYKEAGYSKDDKISDICSEINRTPETKALILICEITKTPYYNTILRGYSQGDAIEVFLIATESYLKEMDFDKSVNIEDRLKSSAELYKDWAFGDVYGFTIDEIGDSCGGFYGYDHEANGLLEMAKDTINGYLERVKKAKEAKIKELIKNRVPLHLRVDILKNISL